MIWTTRLVPKTGFIDYNTWCGRRLAPRHLGCREFGPIVTAVESFLERQLSVTVIDPKPRFRRLQVGRILVEQGEQGEELFLLFDGMLQAEMDGKAVTKVGPGVILGELALLHEGRRTATLRAMTPCRSRSFLWIRSTAGARACFSDRLETGPVWRAAR